MPRTIDFYDEHLKKGFKDIGELPREELDFLLSVHDKKVEYFKEERKMHFGAFTLVALLFFIILPQVISGGEYWLSFSLLEGLLFLLMAPYIFYYAWYENRLRKLESYYFVILEVFYRDIGNPKKSS